MQRTSTRSPSNEQPRRVIRGLCGNHPDESKMTPDLFERLLHEDEGATLDFKVGQYAFAGADAQQKSELLKDILGFVNGWRRAEAYILIGVKEIRGGRSEVVGIAAGMADWRLRQVEEGRSLRSTWQFDRSEQARDSRRNHEDDGGVEAASGDAGSPVRRD